jgi:hypothetical protein
VFACLFLGRVSLPLLTFHPATGKPYTTGYFPSTRTHINLCFDPPVKNDHGHQTSSQPRNVLYDCATHQKKLRNWHDPWDAGTKDASTKCGIPLLTQTTALSSISGSTETYECTNADPDIITSTDMHETPTTYFSSRMRPDLWSIPWWHFPRLQ